METWLVILYTICLAALLTSLYHISSISRHKGKEKKKLPAPPGPIPILGILSFLGKSFAEIEDILRSLFSKYGPVIKLPLVSPTVVISSGTLAYQALVQNSAIFSDKVKPGLTGKIVSADQHTISSAAYGPTWRLLRRNMATFLHPSRYKLYSHTRQQLLRNLVDRITTNAQSHMGVVQLLEHFQFAFFSMLSFMCYGKILDEESVNQIEKTIRWMMDHGGRYQILNLSPLLTKTLFHGRLKEFLAWKRDLDMTVLPHIEAREQAKNNRQLRTEEKEDSNDHGSPAYTDSLLELELEEEGKKRALTKDELANLCSEFIVAGSDTTSTVLQWTMANVIKYPAIQERILEEIKDVLGEAVEEVKEEDLPKLNYLRAVVLEGLRRHPAGHFTNPRSVTEDVEFGGYTLPKGTSVNFMVCEMNWDPKVWKEPMMFKPERFLTNGGGSKEEAFDVTCSREVKMLTFGAGRRICPGYALAMMHLEYFVANLVLKFRLEPVEGDDIDLAEKHIGPFVFMKHPLRARISTRTEESQ